MNKQFVLLNLLFIPYYTFPYTFSHNILLNISSTLYWSIQNERLRPLLLFIDRCAILNAMYNSFVMTYHYSIPFCILGLGISGTGTYIHYLSHYIPQTVIAEQLHLIYHLHYHFINYYMLYIILFHKTASLASLECVSNVSRMCLDEFNNYT